MHRQKRQHVVTQWPPAHNAPYKGQHRVRNIDSNSSTNSIESPEIQFDVTTSEGQALQMDNNKLEEYIDRQSATIIEKHVQALHDRILLLENHVQTMQERISSLENQVAQLEAANKERAANSAIIPLAGGMATTASKG